MDFLAADIVDRFYTFMWPMLRISALLLTAPLFSTAAVPRRIRVLAGLALAWFIYPLHDWPVIRPISAPGVVERREYIKSCNIVACASLNPHRLVSVGKASRCVPTI